jgi:K+-transporting ATPase c subunit
MKPAELYINSRCEWEILDESKEVFCQTSRPGNVGCIALLSLRAVAQEVRSEVSVQGTGFFTKDSNGNGIENKAKETGGLLIGYRYNITRWLAAEANYGYDRNTQSYIGSTSGGVRRTFTKSPAQQW